MCETREMQRIRRDQTRHVVDHRRDGWHGHALSRRLTTAAALACGAMMGGHSPRCDRHVGQVRRPVALALWSNASRVRRRHAWRHPSSA